MKAGAAGNNVQVFNFGKNFLRFRAKTAVQQPPAVHPAFQRFRYRPGLLENFFLHKVAVVALIGSAVGLLRLLHRAFHGAAVAVKKPRLFTAELDHVPFFEKHKALGYRQ